MPRTVTDAERNSRPSGAVRADDFVRLSEQWRVETAWSSDPMDTYSHPAYRAIIQLGPVVLPWILQSLDTELALWFGALEELAERNVAAAVEPGDLQAMREAWLSWGREQGLIAA